MLFRGLDAPAARNSPAGPDEVADGRVPSGVTAANTAATTADNTCQGWTVLEYRPSAQTV